MPCLVMQVAGGLHWFGILHNRRQRATFSAQLATLAIAVPQNVVVAQMSYYFVSQVACDGLRPLIPEDDPSLPVHHAQTGLQRFQNRPVNLGVMQSRHASSSEVFATSLIGKICDRLKPRSPPSPPQKAWRLALRKLISPKV